MIPLGFARVESVRYHIDSGRIECLTEGGPATDVIWNRSGPFYEQTKTMVDAEKATYLNILHISSSETNDYAGTFKCEVRNNRGTNSMVIGPYHSKQSMLYSV